MKRLALPAILIAVAVSPAWSETCPDAPDHSAPLNDLIRQIQQATDAGQAQPLANRMWEFWADAPNEQSQAVLDRGMTKRSSWDLAGAKSDFDTLVEYCPNYAEGYNQRAVVSFLSEDYAAALEDMNRALDLSPRHVAAMSGKALSLMGLGRMDEASRVLDQALKLNPWLPERGLAGPGGPLELKAKDI